MRIMNELKNQTLAKNEQKSKKIGQLLEENESMNEKLNQNEVIRKRIMEKNIFLEKEVKKLSDEAKSLEDTITSFYNIAYMIKDLKK